MNWSEREVQLALFWWLQDRGRTLIMPNFTPNGWQECDMFSLTTSLFFHEIEVKVSRADFRSEFNSKRYKHMVLRGDKALSRGQRSPPRTFSFACPYGLLSESDVPEYAGLIWVDRKKGHWDCAWPGHTIHVIKKAPVIKGAQKIEPAQVFKISNNLWWRYADAWRGKAELEIKNKWGDTCVATR